MVGASAQTPQRPDVSPALHFWSTGHPVCDPTRKLGVRRCLSWAGVGALTAPLSLRDSDDALGRLESVIAVVTREAPPLWPPRSIGRASACPSAATLAGLPVGYLAADLAAGCSRPGGALAIASSSAESCLFSPRGDRGSLPCAAWGRCVLTADECSLGPPRLLYHLVRQSSSSCTGSCWRVCR